MPQNRNYIPLPIPTGGVHRELSQIDMPNTMLRDAENWIYRDGRLRVRDGLTLLGTAAQSGRAVGFVQWFDGTTPVLVMATTAKYYEWNTTTLVWTDRSGSLTGDETTHNIMRVYQKGAGGGTTTTMYGCNGVNENKKMVEGDASVSAMGGGVPISKAMMVLGDRMILGNIAANGTYAGVIGPQVVSVSTSQDPTTGYGTVLEAQLQDTPGQIVAMLEMGNLQGAIYKDDAIYLATVATDIVPYTFALKAVVPGPVSPRAVVRVNDSLHIYLATNGDIMRFDGVSATPMGRHLQRYVLDNWNRLMAIRTHGWYDHENNEVVMMFPDKYTGDCTRGMVIRISEDPPTLWPYNFGTNKITAGIRAMLPGGTRFYDLDGVPSGETVASLTLSFNSYNALGTALCVGDSSGTTYTNDGTTDNAAPISSFYETGLDSFMSPQTWKAPQFIDMVFAPTTSSQTVQVDIKGTSFGEGPNTLSTDTADIDASGQHRTYHRCSSRRLGYRLSCSSTDTVELNAGHIVYAVQGLR